MVRFSDMLGGNEDAPRSRAQEPAGVEPEPDVQTTDDEPPSPPSPEAVLDRLTQYASSARASDPPAPTPEAAAPADEPLTPVGDDLLPHPKGDSRKRRGK